ncbi:hypothetical protein NONI108955_08835 [Nocardia ninae]|uniref:Minor tail protein n=1 Tax=Nocardia ninae NBRC 108245 TaxID=1210091 RepID=A0A511MK65_9NOCA|nr:hypothetical protein [Nocardia ninae]GEM40841.1 hypothetical protein NN4_53600 [Nocardia ninae NBRC 108245]
MTSGGILETVATVIGSGTAGAGVTAWFNRRQVKAAAGKTEAEGGMVDAEAARIIADTAVVLVAPLRSQVEALTSRVAVLESENRNTKSLLKIALDHIEELHEWIRDNVPGRRPPRRPTALPR